jgi:sensor histidine kinase YesM
MKNNRLKSFSKKKGLQHRLLKYFSAFATIPIVILSIVISGFLLSVTVDGIKENAKTSFDEIFRYYDGMMEDAYQIGNTVSQDTNIRVALEETFSNDEARYARELMVNSRLFHMLKYTNDNIKAYVLGENGARFKSSDRTLKNITFTEQPWYVKTEQLNQMLWTSPHLSSSITNSLDYYHVSLTIPMKKLTQETILGLVYMDIELDETILTSENSDCFFIINLEDTQIIHYNQLSSKEEESRNKMAQKSRDNIKYWDIQRSNESILVEDGNLITIYRKSNVNDWIYCSVISKDIIYEDIVKIPIITSGIIFLLILISFFASAKVSGTLINPLVQLTAIMEKVQTGDFSARVDSGSTGEIGQLEDSFNYMVNDINDLMNQVVEEKDKTRQYELMLLQAQIKPHFLYNTFDSAIWLIRIGEYEDAIRMIQELTAFLRSGLNKGKDVIDLRQEISNVVSYLEIQILRYKKKLTYEVDIPEEMFDFELPKLVLQPLVENALYHGIKNKKEGGMIYVYGYDNEDETVIVVSDDGIGMTEEAVSKLLNSKHDLSNDAMSSYGFKNVYERLFMFFKDRLSLEIESKIEIGTTVRIKISKEQKNV